jgi:hypothetical protein
MTCRSACLRVAQEILEIYVNPHCKVLDMLAHSSPCQLEKGKVCSFMVAVYQHRHTAYGNTNLVS